MTTHAPFPTLRRSAAGLLAAALLTSFAAAAVAADGANVGFTLQPVDSTVVAGQTVGFGVETDLHPAAAQYQWYRNDVAIPGATGRVYRLTAQSADNGARYHVVAQGNINMKGIEYRRGPTPSRQATLTVLAAGSSLTPSITAPDTSGLHYLYDSNNSTILATYLEFRAAGNDLEWTYRFDTEEPATAWHLLPAYTLGAQAVRFDIAPPAGAARLTVRVVDAAGVVATRTWDILGAGSEPRAVSITGGPADSTVVAGHAVTFMVITDIASAASCQWYRNDVAIGGATAASYAFTAQGADDGARYHVVASGLSSTSQVLLPTPSPKATLTVLPAGSALSPQLVAPTGATIYIGLPGVFVDPPGRTQGFRAVGNNLTWSYRYAEDAAGTWRTLDPTTTGAEYVKIVLEYNPAHASITVRVVDDASVEATRTWAIVVDQPPTILGTTVSASTVPWPGPVTLSVSATDPDGDPLTYAWYVDYAASVEGGNAVFTPSGASCTATFTKFGKYQVYAAVSDGKVGRAVQAYEVITVEATFDVRTDVNGDGVVNALDLGLVLDNFGQVVP